MPWGGSVGLLGRPRGGVGGPVGLPGGPWRALVGPLGLLVPLWSHFGRLGVVNARCQGVPWWLFCILKVVRLRSVLGVFGSPYETWALLGPLGPYVPPCAVMGPLRSYGPWALMGSNGPWAPTQIIYYEDNFWVPAWEQKQVKRCHIYTVQILTVLCDAFQSVA